MDTMDIKSKMVFTVLSFAIAALMLSALNNGIPSEQKFTAFAEENEAEIEADIEQENKCKKDTECENENELNNSLTLVQGNQSAGGQLTVIKEVQCTFEEPNGSGLGVNGHGTVIPSISQQSSVMTNVAFIPVGNGPSPDQYCEFFAEDLEAQDFEFTVTGNNPSPSTFAGSESGVVVTLGQGSYDVEETSNIPSILNGPGFAASVDIQTTETGDCSGNIQEGESKSCTFTNEITLGRAPV
ncbi:MAG: hypothetical protein DA328_05730 [Nitrososphaeraceae archaeon]|nr:hypothetical protein [Nitrososphaeraceae archaeon]